jgi:hypothetical protein
VHLRYAAVFVDHVSDATGIFVLRRARGAVGQADLAVGIAEQREWELVFFREAGAVLDLVEADAEDLGVLGFVFVDEVPEPGPFERSPGCVRFGKEPEHDFLAAKVLQLHRARMMIADFEIGRRIANLQHRSTSASHE